MGRHVAARLGWDFRDADTVLETSAGKSIAEVFASEGEVGFRDRESAVLAGLAGQSRCVVATGGGVVLRQENRAILRSAGFVAWLTASPETLWNRLSTDPTTAGRRPNLTATGGLDEVIRLLAIREPLYREVAHIVVDTEGRSPEVVATDILSAWETRADAREPRPSS